MAFLKYLLLILMIVGAITAQDDDDIDDVRDYDEVIVPPKDQKTKLGTQDESMGEQKMEQKNKKKNEELKVVFIFLIFGLTVGAGIIPQKFKNHNNSQHLLGIANTFSGGVFLAIAFVHIIPETASSYYMYALRQQSEKFNHEHNSTHRIFRLENGVAKELTTQREYNSDQMTEHVERLLDGQFPLPFVLVLMGYSFILLIDKVLIDSHEVDTQMVCQHEIQGNEQNMSNAGPVEKDDGDNFLDEMLLDDMPQQSGSKPPRSGSFNNQNRPDLVKEGLLMSASFLDNTKMRTNSIASFADLKRVNSALSVQYISPEDVKDQEYEFKRMFSKLDKFSRVQKENTQNMRNKKKTSFVSSKKNKSDESIVFSTPRISAKSYKKGNNDFLYSLNQDSLFVPEEPTTPDFVVKDDQQSIQIKKAENTSNDENDMRKRRSCCEDFNLTSFVLLIALSTHALFEGIALGLTKEFAATLNIMLALCIHKTAASMSLGISISKNFDGDDRNKGLVLLYVFSLATPVGIAIGLMLQGTNEMVEIVFSSFAGGTFVYIAASEVIVEEFSIPGRKKWLQMIVFLLGAAIITSLWLFEG